MDRFYINLINHTGEVCDEPGHLFLTDLAAARTVAKDGIRSILSDEIMTGVLDLRERAEIKDRAGTVLAVLAFGDACELRTDS